MTPTDNEILKKTVVDQLTWDSSVNANNVFVNVQDGKVELSGNVENMAARMAAERNAHEVQGVLAVNNRLTIKFPPGSALPTDAELKNNVENLLSWNNELNVDHIDVKCINNVVTLSGTVETYWEKHHTSTVVGAVKGVLEVINEISVVPAMTQNDESIKEEISKAFQRTYLIDDGKILVEVVKGVVKLTGNVPNFFVKMQAKNMAKQTRGVKEVIDYLSLV